MLLFNEGNMKYRENFNAILVKDHERLLTKFDDRHQHRTINGGENAREVWQFLVTATC